MTQTGFAPAKVNLYLHVGPLGADGYHPLVSWMMFADVGDRLTIEASDAAAFEVRGPFAAEVPADAANLAARARDGLFAAAGVEMDPFRLILEKTLPPASGLGGGSSDAAAVLRLLADRAPLPKDALAALALSLGADVPACLEARSVLAQGRGERLSPAPAAPRLAAVLVNPLVAVSTARVFARFDAEGGGGLGTVKLPARFATITEVVRALAATRNDLEAAAVAIEPAIGAALAALDVAPQTLLARMSGSGATCFALTEDRAAAQALAERMAQDHPAWWVAACTLS